MGVIFSRAKKVVSWLGDDVNIAKFLRIVSKDLAEHSGTTIFIQPGLGLSFYHLCVAEYWDRAWITQEVVLARKITLIAAGIELDGLSFPLLLY